MRKPSNVLVGPDGRAYLTDFRLAATAAGPGEPAGTLAYTAPEVLGGAGSADGRSEVYGLGVVLYEVLTGARAFPGATASEVRARVLAGQPPRPRSLCPAVPAALEWVCLRAMACDPADRHPTVEDFSRALGGRSVRHRGRGSSRSWPGRSPC
jgi:eukaryotic-like serine/threonine-protein kinase